MLHESLSGGRRGTHSTRRKIIKVSSIASGRRIDCRSRCMCEGRMQVVVVLTIVGQCSLLLLLLLLLLCLLWSAVLRVLRVGIELLSELLPLCALLEAKSTELRLICLVGSATTRWPSSRTRCSSSCKRSVTLIASHGWR